jgi:hypothetical protein
MTGHKDIQNEVIRIAGVKNKRGVVLALVHELEYRCNQQCHKR